MGNREAALFLASSGIAVFPCKGAAGADDDDAKRPAAGIFGWRRQSTVDPRQIGRWWDRHPEAMPAIDIGKSGLLAIDCDRPKREGEADGIAWFSNFAAGHQFDIDAVPGTITLHGGRHFFFRQPGGSALGNGRGGLPPKPECGVDVRGAGGYVVAPGASLPDGRGYQAVGSLADAPECPPWLEALLTASPSASLGASPPVPDHSPPVPHSRSHGDDARITAYVEAGVKGELDKLRSMREGGRNNALNDAALKLGRMVASGWISEADVYSWLEAAAADIGLVRDDGIKQVRATIRSGLGRGLKEPRQLPPERSQEPSALGAEVARRLAHAGEGTAIDAETDEIVGLDTIVAASLHGQDIPPRKWHVPDMIPAHTVTILGGDGGTGKSLLALQLAAATALNEGFGTEWIGCPVSPGRALYLSAEDELDEMHRRLADIAAAEKAGMDMLADLILAPLAGQDAVMAVPRRDGTIEATRLWHRMEATIDAVKPALVILDTLADLFAGDENNRAQARQFVGMLRGLAMRHATTVVILAHPSQSGLSSGSGTSGSTAWNNSVRSRLYFNRILSPKERGSSELVEADPDVRMLSSKKANYARRGSELKLRWHAGTFIRDDDTSPFAQANAMVQAEAKFIELLRYRLNTLKSRVGPTPGTRNYAPKVFATDYNSGGITQSAFEAAMNRMLESGRLIIEEQGPPSDRHPYIFEAPGDPSEPLGT